MTVDTVTLNWPADAQPRVAEIRSRYPSARAAIMPLLWEAQTIWNHVSDDAKHLVARTLDVPVVWVEEVASFYIMYHHKPVGKHVIWMCRNLSCQLRGFVEIKEAIEKHLRIEEGETTADGKFTLLSNECLGACGGAPMLQLDDSFYENLTPQSVTQLLDEVAKR